MSVVTIGEVSIWRSLTVHDKTFSNLKFIVVKEFSTFPLKKYSSWLLSQFLQQNFIFWRKLESRGEENITFQQWWSLLYNLPNAHLWTAAFGDQIKICALRKEIHKVYCLAGNNYANEYMCHKFVASKKCRNYFL